MLAKQLLFTSLFLFILGASYSQSLNYTNASSIGTDQPNILLIMADDLGYSDIGCYGGEINTPNLNRLAEEGIRFTQFYNAARCCPTRASLLTGISPHLAGMGGMVKGSPAVEPYPYQGYLNQQCVTLAEVLKTAGYRNYMTGKWHVGEFRPVFPVDRGFDHYYGLISGAINYWNMSKGKREGIKRTFAEDDKVINDQVQNQEDFYSTVAYTDKAISYLKDHFDTYSAQPFFLYIAHQAPHWPLHAPDSAIMKYRGKYKKGWAKLREERYGRMKKLGVVGANVRLSPLDEATAEWESLTEEQKDTMDLKMATHAAMIDVMDAQIGRVVATLEKYDQLDNTIIMFLADNGASSESGALGHNFRPDLTGEIGTENSYHSFGLSWANAANTPFRKFKQFTYEGGFATPFIVRWGDKMANKNRFSDALGHIMDLMATVVDVSGAQYPTERNGQDIHPMEGKSLVPILKGEADEIRTSTDYLFWEHMGNHAVRKGKWKLVTSKGEENWHLYDTKKDRTELKNVHDQYPEIAQQLAEKYEDWAKRVGVGKTNLPQN